MTHAQKPSGSILVPEAIIGFIGERIKAIHGQKKNTTFVYVRQHVNKAGAKRPFLKRLSKVLPSNAIVAIPEYV